jgi:hypothetical protein
MESLGKLWGKDLGSNLFKVSLELERGFKILLGKDVKFLSHDIYIGKIPTQVTKVGQVHNCLSTVTLNRHSPRFSDDKITTSGES